MRKSLLATAIVIAAGGAVSPWIMGSVAEKQFNQSVELMQQDENDNISITETSFERGYATSKTRIKLGFQFPEEEIPPFSVVIESDLQHTPISKNDAGTYFFEVASTDTVFLEDVPAEVQGMIDQYLGGVLFKGNSNINMFGYGRSVLETQAITYEDALSQVSAKSSPLQLIFEGNVGSNSGSAQVILAESSFKSPDAEVDVKDISIDSNYDEHASGLTIGTSLINVKEINVMAQAGPAKFTNMSLSSTTDVVNEKMNTKATYSIEKIESMLPISSVRYDMELNGVSQDAVAMAEELNKKAEEFQPTSFSTDPFYGQFIKATLQPGLELNQELEIAAFDGKIFADLDVMFTGVEGVELEALANPEMAPKALKASFVARADNEAIFRTPAAPMIIDLIQQGMLQQNNTEVFTEVKLVDGKLTVNEQEIPIEAVVQGILMQMAAAEEQSVQ